MVNVNSAGRSPIQLESLDSLRANNLQAQTQTVQNNNAGSGLQSLDSLMTNNYTAPNGGIPNEDVLAPIDAMNPEINGQDPQDVRERGATGFIGGVFKGFGKAGLDTVKGVVTLGKITISAIANPKDTARYVGGGIKHAINHPIDTAKTIAIDLPVGIVKGIINPYAEAIKNKQFGQAVGRGVFDVGLILMTAGLGEGSEGSKAGVEAGKGSSKAAKAAIESIAPAAEGGSGAAVVSNNTINGGIKVSENAIRDVIKATGKGKNVFNGPVNINVNIGGTVITNSGSAAKTAAQTGEVLAGVEKATRTATVATEAIGKSGRIAIGVGDIGGAISRGANKIGGLFKPIQTGMGNTLSAIVGENTAAIISQGANTIKHGIGVGGKFIADGGRFVKAHPLPSALIAGKAVDIVDKGLKATDHYDPGSVE